MNRVSIDRVYLAKKGNIEMQRSYDTIAHIELLQVRNNTLLKRYENNSAVPRRLPTYANLRLNFI